MLKVKEIFWHDYKIIIQVIDEEILKTQAKFYGNCIATHKDSKEWLGKLVETPFLYKSQFDVLKGGKHPLKEDF